MRVSVGFDIKRLRIKCADNTVIMCACLALFFFSGLLRPRPGNCANSAKLARENYPGWFSSYLKGFSLDEAAGRHGTAKSALNRLVLPSQNCSRNTILRIFSGARRWVKGSSLKVMMRGNLNLPNRSFQEIE